MWVNDVSVICCFYNEIKVLEKKFIEIENFSKQNKNFEFIFLDNASDDGTTEFLKEREKKNIQNFKFIFNNSNLGKGGSVKEGIKISNSKIAAIFDIDEYKLEDLEFGIKKFVENNLSLSIGSRLIEKKKFIYKKNYYGVVYLTKLINILFSCRLTDAAGAIKIFNIGDYKNMKIETNGFDFEFELICKFASKKLKIGEFPSDYSPRTFQEGKKLNAVYDGTKIFIVIIKNFFKKFK